jgi:hypothetical protein
MEQLDNVSSVTQEIIKATENSTFITEFQNLNRFRSAATSSSQNAQNVINILNNLQQIIASIDTTLWTSEHKYVSEKLGIAKFMGSDGTLYFENIKNQILANPTSTSVLITNLYTELNNFRTKPKQFLTILKDFDLNFNIETLNENEGVIEIVFDGKVDIEDFKDAKDQMNDWFYIIEGYSRLLGVPREEFEIINISKNSPAKFKIKTTLKNTATVLGIVTSVVVIQQHLIQNQLLIEKLRETEMGPDKEAQEQIINNWESHLQKQIDEKIETLVEKKLNQYEVENDRGEIKNVLSKGIHNQYNFIVNGGTVNIKVIDSTIKPKVEKLENAKQKIKEIQAPFLNQKAIDKGEAIVDEDEEQNNEITDDI